MINSNLETKIYDVYWKTPYSLDTITQDRGSDIVKEWH